MARMAKGFGAWRAPPIFEKAPEPDPRKVDYQWLIDAATTEVRLIFPRLTQEEAAELRALVDRFNAERLRTNGPARDRIRTETNATEPAPEPTPRPARDLILDE